MLKKNWRKYFLIALVAFLFVLFTNKADKPEQTIDGSQFSKYLESNQIKSVNIITSTNDKTSRNYDIELSNGQKVTLLRDSSLLPNDVKSFDDKKVIYKEELKSNSIFSTIFTDLFSALISIVGMIFAIWFINRGTKQAINMSTKKYQVIDFSDPNNPESKLYNTTLDDVIGLPETTKQELYDIASFMSRYGNNEELIGDFKLDGLLLYGPPGTGKSMIAKALARTLKFPFIDPGSDFMKKFVGEGATNINNLFELARKISISTNKPTIIFLDEIDSVGGKRSNNSGSQHEEQIATLNALLRQMSGVESNAKVFVIGATNRKDSLDEALLRSGRFSVHLEVPIPMKKGREELFNYYFSKLPKEIIMENVDTSILAEYSVRMTGADIFDITEQIKKKANGHNRKLNFNLDDMIEIIETKMYGLVKVEHMEDSQLLGGVAIHEAGHALMALRHFPENVLKACITPRQGALGYVMHNILDKKLLLSTEESKSYIELALGGHVAEKIFLDHTTSGVQQDLEQANHAARNLVQRYGALDSLLVKPDSQYKEGLSSNTMYEQEQQIDKLLNESRKNVSDFLTENKELLKKFAKLLLDKKVLNKKDIQNFYNEHKDIIMKGLNKRVNVETIFND